MITSAFLQTVYGLVKIFGLVPFRLNFGNSQQPAVFDSGHFVHSLISAAGLNGFNCYIFMSFVSGPIDDVNQGTLIIALKIERVCEFAQNIVAYLSMYYYRNQLIDCINVTRRIHVEIRDFVNITEQYDAELKRIINYVIVWTTVQSILTLSSGMLYNANSSMTPFQITIILIFAYCFVIVLTLMQFAMLMEFAQLYRWLNAKLLLCIKRIRQLSRCGPKQGKKKLFCTVGDDIEKVVLFYELVNSCQTTVCRVMSIPILGNVVNSFANALIAVISLFIFVFHSDIHFLYRYSTCTLILD